MIKKMSLSAAERQRLYRQRWPQRIKEIRRRFYLTHKGYFKDKNKKWRQNNPEKNSERLKQWRRDNKERVSELKKRWRVENRDSINRSRFKRYRSDDAFRIRKVLSSRLTIALRKQGIVGRRIQSISELLGCGICELRVYLESRFQLGMSWDNYGKGSDKWNIDHIRPCASFDLSKRSDQEECFHYSNLQPLWQLDNSRKQDTWVDK